jgi:hypothetical protein
MPDSSIQTFELQADLMSRAYFEGRKMGIAMRGCADDIEWLNPYEDGSIDAMEWDRGFNHGRYANNYDD